MGQIIMEKSTGNYGTENIDSVRRMLADESKSDVMGEKAFTMIQKNASCEVEISETSRKKCAKAIIQ